MLRNLVLLFISTICFYCFELFANEAEKRVAEINPGVPWMDESGNPINAHSGGVLFFLTSAF